MFPRSEHLVHYFPQWTSNNSLETVATQNYLHMNVHAQAKHDNMCCPLCLSRVTYEFVSWDDDIPIYYAQINFMFQTTHQIISLPNHISSYNIIYLFINIPINGAYG